MMQIHIQHNLNFKLPFFQILQGGFTVKCPKGMSIKAFLLDLMGLDEQYIAEKINTIFLDGKCVDDINAAFIKDQAILALSSAMPGLAGAIMKRDGPLKTMREGITYKKEEIYPANSWCECSVKLFNLLIEDLGDVFLRFGIYIKAREDSGLLMMRPLDVWQKHTMITINGKRINPETLIECLSDKEKEEEKIHLTVDAKWIQ